MTTSPPPPVRVLVATTNFALRERGDVTANFVVDPVMALGRDPRVEVTVLAPLDDRIAAPREEFSPGVQMHRFSYWWPRRTMRLAYGQGIPTHLKSSWLARLQVVPFVVAFTLAILRDARRADVIQAHWLPVALLAFPARAIHGTPMVVTLHGTDITQFPSWFTKRILRRVDGIVTAHEDLRRAAAELAPDVPCHQIRHLVEPQHVPDAARDELAAWIGGADVPVGVFVARFSPERDPVSFVRAVPHALALCPEAKFVVVGDGVLMPEVRAAVAGLDLDGRVLVTGYRSDVWTFLERGDCFAALSDRNNIWVTALIEAMRAGLPCVVTRSGDAETALTDGIDALLVDVGDAAQIGDAMGRLLADPEVAARIARGATAKLSSIGFDPEVVIEETVALYRGLAS